MKTAEQHLAETFGFPDLVWFKQDIGEEIIALMLIAIDNARHEAIDECELHAEIKAQCTWDEEAVYHYNVIDPDSILRIKAKLPPVRR